MHAVAIFSRTVFRPLSWKCPSDATLAQSHVFMGLSEDQETKYNKAFQALIGG